MAAGIIAVRVEGHIQHYGWVIPSFDDVLQSPSCDILPHGVLQADERK
jgi:hypothetical protein